MTKRQAQRQPQQLRQRLAYTHILVGCRRVCYTVTLLPRPGCLSSVCVPLYCTRGRHCVWGRRRRRNTSRRSREEHHSPVDW